MYCRSEIVSRCDALRHVHLARPVSGDRSISPCSAGTIEVALRFGFRYKPHELMAGIGLQRRHVLSPVNNEIDSDQAGRMPEASNHLWRAGKPMSMKKRLLPSSLTHRIERKSLCKPRKKEFAT